ncbi:MAG: hypothetical protein ACXVXB_17100 [Nocardioidaceae bacterium]
MSTTSYSAPTTPDRWGAGRVTAVVVGALVFLFGAGLFLSGAALGIADRVLRDDQGYLMSPSRSVSTPGAALVSRTIKLHGNAASVFSESLLGHAKARVDPAAGRSVFVGVGRSGAVAAYLAGVAQSTVLDPGGPNTAPTYRYHPGGGPRVPPAHAGIWTSAATGPGRVSVTWPLEQGDWTLVVMNADGSRPVVADVAVGATVPAAVWIFLGLIIAGLVLMGVGVVVLVAAVRRPRPRPQPAQQA